VRHLTYTVLGYVRFLTRSACRDSTPGGKYAVVKIYNGARLSEMIVESPATETRLMDANDGWLRFPPSHDCLRRTVGVAAAAAAAAAGVACAFVCTAHAALRRTAPRKLDVTTHRTKTRPTQTHRKLTPYVNSWS